MTDIDRSKLSPETQQFIKGLEASSVTDKLIVGVVLSLTVAFDTKEYEIRTDLIMKCLELHEKFAQIEVIKRMLALGKKQLEARNNDLADFLFDGALSLRALAQEFETTRGHLENLVNLAAEEKRKETSNAPSN